MSFEEALQYLLTTEEAARAAAPPRVPIRAGGRRPGEREGKEGGEELGEETIEHCYIRSLHRRDKGTNSSAGASHRRRKM